MMGTGRKMAIVGQNQGAKKDAELYGDWYWCRDWNWYRCWKYDKNWDLDQDQI